MTDFQVVRFGAKSSGCPPADLHPRSSPTIAATVAARSSENTARSLAWSPRGMTHLAPLDPAVRPMRIHDQAALGLQTISGMPECVPGSRPAPAFTSQRERSTLCRRRHQLQPVVELTLKWSGGKLGPPSHEHRLSRRCFFFSLGVGFLNETAHVCTIYPQQERGSPWRQVRPRLSSISSSMKSTR